MIRTYIFLIVSLSSLANSLVCQSTIDVEQGPINHQNTDGPVVDSYNDIDISDCSSIQFKADFNFSGPYPGSGTMNMEAADELSLIHISEPRDRTRSRMPSSA